MKGRWYWSGHCKHSQQAIVPAAGNIAATAADAIPTTCCYRARQGSTRTGVFPFRRIPFRRMPCKLCFPSFSFLIPFINAIQPFYGCQRNARKNITITVSVRVSVTFRVSLVWRHRHILFRKISKWHGFFWDSAKRDSANWDSAKWGITQEQQQQQRYSYDHRNNSHEAICPATGTWMHVLFVRSP